MTTGSWIRKLFASRRPRSQGPQGSRKAPGARFRPRVDSLEDRLTPSTTINVGPTTADLIAAINTADQTAGPVILVLPANTIYTLTRPDNPLNGGRTREDNNWYGPNGLPAIDNNITIAGDGATIQRSTARGTPNFRLFYVSGGLAGELPPGSPS